MEIVFVNDAIEIRENFEQLRQVILSQDDSTFDHERLNYVLKVWWDCFCNNEEAFEQYYLADDLLILDSRNIKNYSQQNILSYENIVFHVLAYCVMLEQLYDDVVVVFENINDLWRMTIAEVLTDTELSYHTYSKHDRLAIVLKKGF